MQHVTCFLFRFLSTYVSSGFGADRELCEGVWNPALQTPKSSTMKTTTVLICVSLRPAQTGLCDFGWAWTLLTLKVTS